MESRLRTERRKEVVDLLTVLCGGTRGRVHLAWVPIISGFGYRLITVGPGGRDLFEPAYVPLITERLSFSFEESWRENEVGRLGLQYSRLVLHDAQQDMKGVLVLEAEPFCEPGPEHTPYKRGWHVHMKELPSPWKKLHFALFPLERLKRLACFDADERRELNAKMRRVLRMLWVELVRRRWKEWQPSA